MRLIAVGRLKGPEAELFARYAGRLRPPLAVTELPEAAGAAAEARRREGEAILAAAGAGAFLVALDLGGRALGTEAFAAQLGAWRDQGRTPVFVIGGAEGLAEAVRARAGFTLALGPMTWPHMLARVLLAEQIYRAQAIAAGHPYHRAWRP